MRFRTCSTLSTRVRILLLCLNTVYGTLNHYISSVHPDYIGVRITDGRLTENSTLGHVCVEVGFLWKKSLPFQPMTL